MKSSYKAFVLLGVLFAFVLVVSVANDEKKVNEAEKHEVTGEADKTEVNGWGGGGGGGGCGHRGCGGGGGGGGCGHRGCGGGGGHGYCHHGCCGKWRGGSCSYCCRTVEEAKAYALASQGLNHANTNP